MIERLVVPNVNVRGVVAGVAGAQIEIPIVLHYEIHVVEKETVEAVIDCFFEANIEEFSPIEGSESPPFFLVAYFSYKDV